jgi:hypothetical protein
MGDSYFGYKPKFLKKDIANDVGCDGAMKPKTMLNHMTCETTMIDKHQKFIEEKYMFEKDNYEFD